MVAMQQWCGSGSGSSNNNNGYMTYNNQTEYYDVDYSICWCVFGVCVCYVCLMYLEGLFFNLLVVFMCVGNHSRLRRENGINIFFLFIFVLKHLKFIRMNWMIKKKQLNNESLISLNLNLYGFCMIEWCVLAQWIIFMLPQNRKKLPKLFPHILSQ